MGKPRPDLKLHANRKHTTPWKNQGPNNVMSRGDILSGRTPTHYGMKGSPPTLWPKAGHPLNVPKCVILSSLPNWTLMWEEDVIYAPRDVITIIPGTNPVQTANYYYFEQWDKPQTYMNGDWNLSDPRLSDPKIYYPPASGEQRQALSLNFQIANASEDPTSFLSVDQFQDSDFSGARFHQAIGSLRNNIPKLHRETMAACITASARLLALKEPIYTYIPEWFPPYCYSVRNGYLTESKERAKVEKAHWNPAVNPCDVHDAVPCYHHYPGPWAPGYPNVNDPRNTHAFQQPNIPWLLTADPGFGTDVLHLYSGMPMHRYYPDDSMWPSQAYPLTPEGNFIGPLFNSNYLGSPILPYFAGRRGIWTYYGYDFGYKAGVPAIYNNYAALIGPAADNYKNNFYNYRGMNTVLGTYPGNLVEIDINTGGIWQDQKNDCVSTQFYFGYSFSDFAKMFSSGDHWFHDCSGSEHLAFATSFSNFPTKEDIDKSSFFYPAILERMHNYYDNIKKGTLDYFQYAIDKQGLGDYGVSVGGPDMTDPDAIVDYVRTYFK